MGRSQSVAAALLVAAGIAVTGSARADLVVNGGFETGSFTGWTQVGDTTFNGVQCPGTSPTVHSGNCSAFFGPVGTTGGISQLLATTAGNTYDITFWLMPDGGAPSSFAFNWDGGAAELLLTNPPVSAVFERFDFHLLASSNSTSITFLFRDDPGFMLLDDVSVNQAQAVPEPTSLLLAAIALGAAALTRRRRTA